MTDDPKRMSPERLAFTRAGLVEPTPYSDSSAREEIGALLAHIDALTAEPSRVEDTEVERIVGRLLTLAEDCTIDGLGFDPKSATSKNDHKALKGAADLIRRLAAAKASAEEKLRELDSSWMVEEFERLRPTFPEGFAPHGAKILKLQAEKHNKDLEPIRLAVLSHKQRWDRTMANLRALSNPE